MKRIITALLSVMVVSSLFAGAAVAYSEEPTDILHETVTPTEDTQGVFVEVEANGSLGGDTLDATVTIEGLNGSEEPFNGTELVSEPVSITEDNGVAIVEYELVDGDVESYDSIHLHVAGDTEADADLVGSTDFGTFERMSGGGGLLDGSGSSSTLLLVGGVLVGGYFLMGRD